MKKVLLINGSPRGEISTSHALLRYMEMFINVVDTEIVSVSDYKNGNMKELVLKASSATDLIISFPLYFNSVPAMLQNFLEEFGEFLQSRKDRPDINLYGVVNCGFPEEENNETVLRILQFFARRCGLRWMYGAGISMGWMMNREISFPQSMTVKRVYAEIEKIPAIINNDFLPENDYTLTSPRFLLFSDTMMKLFYILRVQSSWKEKARRNKMIHSLGYRPYSLT